MNTYITINRYGVALIVTLLAPCAVGLLTRPSASNRLRTSLVMLITAVVVFLGRTMNNAGESVFSGDALFDWVLTTAVAIASYLGFWKPVVDVNARGRQ